MKNKVSILIPLYNAEEWIAETITSILNQSYENIEVIIVDDSSTDKSLEIAQSFCSEKVKVITQPNKGACAGRNKAFELSTGDYINFFDADDLLSVDKIKNQMEMVAIFGDDYVYSSKWVAFEKELINLNYTKTPIDYSFENIIDWFNLSWQKNLSAQTGIWLTPRALIEQSGGWDENLKVNQDGDFFFRVLIKSKGIKFVDNSFVYYRRDVKDSISLRIIPERAKDMLKSYMNYETILEINDSYETKKSLAYNYIRFIYIFYPRHKDLIKLAWERINKLNVKEKWLVGGTNFIKMSTFLGFKNALKLRGFLKK